MGCMIVAVSSSVIKHGLRSLRHGGLPLFFAVVMSALGLFSMTAFGTLLWNFRTLSSAVSESVAAVAFLDLDVDGAGAQEVRARIQLLPGVDRCTVMTPDEVLVRARRGLRGGAALEGAGLQMPWVVEVIPRVTLQDSPEARAALVTAIGGVAGVDEVAHPGGELARVDALLRLMYGAGGFLAVLIALVVVVVVSNAVRLMVLVRKDEIAIQKLVGASDAFVAAPLMLTGIAQGIGGALLGLLALGVAHSSLARVVGVALSGTMGALAFEPLPPWVLALVVVGGGVLGLVGAGLSVWRLLREGRP
jgi:cell division transport system permease protein